MALESPSLILLIIGNLFPRMGVRVLFLLAVNPFLNSSLGEVPRFPHSWLLIHTLIYP
jgi:hypothetical protein